MVGCNPIDDINKEIDGNIERIIVVDSDNYTLTADDYDYLDLGYGSFSSLDDAKTMLPGFLSHTYPTWGQGSSVLVGFNLYIGSAEGVSDYSGADAYALTNADYAATGSDAFGFYPNVNATSKIPDVLATQITGPTEGQIVLATYNQYTETPVVGLANLFDYNFAGSFEGWTIKEEFGGDAVWTSLSGYVQGNSYFGGQVANIEWLVSPTMDLSGDSNLKFQITHALKYATDASLLKILVSTNYSGDITTATWDEITLATAPGVDTLDPSEDYDFSAYDGQMVTVALKYESTDTDAGRWRVSNLAIKTLGVTGASDAKGEYFVYSGGAWKAANGVYYLSSADYDSMGTASGQPGRYNNFSSSMPADNYIPTFLDLTSPYSFGQEDAEIIVIYKYYSSSCSCTQTRGNLYTVVNGAWTAHQSTIATTLQFGFNEGKWVPDNTIRYSLTVDDYVTIGAAFADIYPQPASSAGNYKNFDRRSGNAAEWTDAMLVEAFNVLLDGLDPSAAEGQKYLMTFAIYNGAAGIEELGVIKEGGVWVQQ